VDRKKEILNERSTNRLKKEIKKRIQTTMIGSLSSVEKYFEGALTDKHMRETETNEW